MIKFATNPILFKVLYINHDTFDTASNISGVIGSAFHNAMEVYYGGNEEMIVTSEEEAIEFGLKTGMSFLENYNDGFIKFSSTIENKQKAFELFTFAFRQYIQENPYRPEEVQCVEKEVLKEINMEWRGQKLHLPVKMKGRIDKTIIRDGKKIIVDYKTCAKFSDPEKIDGKKIIQAVSYFLLEYADTGVAPYSIIFEEVKYTQNKDGGSQVRKYEIVYEENELFFDFFFRLYNDMTEAINTKAPMVPNLDTLFDNEVGIITYLHMLDVEEAKASLMIENKVNNLTDLLKTKIQNAGNMEKLRQTVEKEFVSAKNLDYDKMNNEEKIAMKMVEFGMALRFDSKIEGATVDLYRFIPTIGLKMSRIRNYVDDIEQVLGISGVRVLAPISGTSLVGFEVPRNVRSFPPTPNSKGYELAIGQTITGSTHYFDIRKAPHMLVAGSTGSGKSVFLHNLIKQLLKLPHVELHLFDPKQIELSQYEEQVKEYRHSHAGILAALEVLVSEMEKRYTEMKSLKVKNIEEMPHMPYKFIIIDEYADLAMKAETSRSIKLLAQKGRACGMHIILATQRASTKVIDGDIKVNFNVKAIFKMSKAVDSMVMLDEPGAEKLLGKGDMLFSSDDGLIRLQGFFN